MEKSKFTLRIDADTLKQFKIYAIKRNMPLNALIVEDFKNTIRLYNMANNSDSMLDDDWFNFESTGSE